MIKIFHIKCFVLLTVFILIISISGCRQSSVSELSQDYSSLLSAKSLADLSLSKINKIKLSYFSAEKLVLSSPVLGANSIFFSQAIDTNSGYSINLGVPQKGLIKGITAGIAYKKGISEDDNGHYYFTARLGYDYLSDTLDNYLVAEGYTINKVEVHQGTLTLTLSPKLGWFKPFISQQTGISTFNYKGQQSGTINLSLEDLFLTSAGIEIEFENWGAMLALTEGATTTGIHISF